jgi:protein-L-isoaspartate(D-aspartate) O-methyltransferase
MIEMTKQAMTHDEMTIVRRAYAKLIVHAGRASDPRLEAALATLRREDFMFPGPWQLMRFPGGYQETPNDDPIYLYQDTPVALLPAKRLNNGQPSFLTSLISLGRLQEGEHAIHIGTGTGYYTAVISHLAGSSGQVTGIEREPELAARATANLRSYANVRMIAGDGASRALDPADVIYVNAGASRIADTWLDAMKPGGRMVLPLTVSFTTEDGHLATRGSQQSIERADGGRSAAASVRDPYGRAERLLPDRRGGRYRQHQSGGSRQSCRFRCGQRKRAGGGGECRSRRPRRLREPGLCESQYPSRSLSE